MAGPSVTWTFASLTIGDAVQMNQNFTDLENAATDGTKDYSVAGLAAAGKFSCAAKFVTSGISTVTATNGASSTIGNGTHVVILSPASAISGYTLKLPDSPTDGQRIIITSGGNDITALTLSPNSGQLFASGVAIPQMRAGMSTELFCKSSLWYLAGCGGRAPITTQSKLGYLSPTSGVYSTPTGCNALYVIMVGGGGGGAGAGLGNNGNGTNGGDTVFGSFTAGGGKGASGIGSAKAGGAGGTPSDPGAYGFSVYGSQGEGNASKGTNSIRIPGGIGGGSPFGAGGVGFAGGAGAQNGANIPTGAGGGGGGAGATNNTWTGAGGGSGAYMELMIPTPGASYSYVAGSMGTGGSAGTNGAAGSDGSWGFIYIQELYS